MTKQWTFLSHHAHALIVVARDSSVTIDALAAECGVTARSMVSILNDLEAGGYLLRERVGRRNRYQVEKNRPLRHPTSAHHSVGDLLDALGDLRA